MDSGSLQFRILARAPTVASVIGGEQCVGRARGRGVSHIARRGVRFVPLVEGATVPVLASAPPSDDGPIYRRAELWTASEVLRAIRAAFAHDRPVPAATDRWLRGDVGRRAIPPISIGGHVRYHPFHVEHYIWQRKRRPARGRLPAWIEPAITASYLQPRWGPPRVAPPEVAVIAAGLFAILSEPPYYYDYDELSRISYDLSVGDLELRLVPTPADVLEARLARARRHLAKRQALQKRFPHLKRYELPSYMLWAAQRPRTRLEKGQDEVRELERRLRRRRTPEHPRVVGHGTITGHVLAAWLAGHLDVQRRDLEELEALASAGHDREHQTLSPAAVAERLRVSARWLRTPPGRRELPVVRAPDGRLGYDRPAFGAFLARKVREAESAPAKRPATRRRATTQALGAFLALRSVRNLEADIARIPQLRDRLVRAEAAVAALEASAGAVVFGEYQIALGRRPTVSALTFVVHGRTTRWLLRMAAQSAGLVP